MLIYNYYYSTLNSSAEHLNIITSYNFLLSVLTDCGQLNLFETRYFVIFFFLFIKEELFPPQMRKTPACDTLDFTFIFLIVAFKYKGVTAI